MRRSSFTIITLFTILAVPAAVGWSMHLTMPEIFIIDKAQSKKGPVSFNHQVHGDAFDCSVCHHNVEKGSMDGSSCFECHGKDADAPDPSLSSASKNPFHILCRGCHKEQGKGPTRCSGCHKT